MNCPEHLVFMRGPLSIWMYWRDVRRETIPLRIWLNPLRYQIIWRRPHLIINKSGRWAHAWPNFVFRLRNRKP